MKAKSRLIGALLALGLMALWAVHCVGDKAGPGDNQPKNPGVKKTHSYCKDKLDNDGDATADYFGVPAHCLDKGVDTCIFQPDPWCQVVIGGVQARGEAACSDGLDNNGDTLVDSADPNCWIEGYYRPQLTFGSGSTIGEMPVPNLTHIDDGANGICESTKSGDDTQMIPFGQGLANSKCIADGGDHRVGTPGGDDVLFPTGCTDGTNCTAILSGPDGVCGTLKQNLGSNDDTQVIPLGQGQPYQNCIDYGTDFILETIPGGDDEYAP